ncbi:MAG: hypothetical protein KC547_09440 [Anaerolineae bacterium]|nr:hypothetical protein [Anaerolineae bacterium]
MKRIVGEALKDAPEFIHVGDLEFDFATPMGNLSLLQSVQRLQADNPDVLVFVLYTQHQQALPGIFTHLLQEFPDVRLLVFAEQNATLTAYWMGLTARELVRAQAANVPKNLRAGIQFLAQLNPLDSAATRATGSVMQSSRED